MIDMSDYNAPQMAKSLRKNWVALVLLAVLAAETAFAIWHGERQHVYNFGIVQPGILYRSGQPATPQAWDWLAAQYKVRTVVDLREERPEAAWSRIQDEACGRHGMRLVHIPMTTRDAPSQEQWGRFVEIVADSSNHPILVHCELGTSRTGAIVGGYGITRCGQTVEQALADARRHFFVGAKHPEYMEFWRGLAQGGDGELDPGTCGWRTDNAGRAAGVASQMQASGQWLLPHSDGRPVLDHPSPMYGLVAIAAAALAASGMTGQAAGMTALVALSIAAAVFLCAASYSLARRAGGAGGGVVAGAMCAAACGWLVAAGLATTELIAAAVMGGAVWWWCRGERTRAGETPATRAGETPATRAGETPATRADETPATRADETPATHGRFGPLVLGLLLGTGILFGGLWGGLPVAALLLVAVAARRRDVARPHCLLAMLIVCLPWYVANQARWAGFLPSVIQPTQTVGLLHAVIAAFLIAAGIATCLLGRRLSTVALTVMVLAMLSAAAVALTLRWEYVTLMIVPICVSLGASARSMRWRAR